MKRWASGRSSRTTTSTRSVVRPSASGRGSVSASTHPGDDLLTNLVNAEVDGQRLTDDDIGAFMVLFTVAGNDTTRNTTSLTAVAVDPNPPERAYLLEDVEGRSAPALGGVVRPRAPGVPVPPPARGGTRR